MRRRLVQDTLELGSDSFLDIVANIVGILIILIVVAGVRVSQSPVALPVLEQANPEKEPLAPSTEPSKLRSIDTATRDQEATVSAVDVGPNAADDVPIEVPLFVEEPAVVVAEPVVIAEPDIVIAPPEPAEPPAELVQRAQELESEIAELSQRIATSGDEAERGRQDSEQLAAQLAKTNEILRARRQELSLYRDQQTALHTQLDASKGQLLNAQFELQKAEREQPPAKKLEHKLTPISKVVNGPEIHFRLIQNQVAKVPIDDLLDLLRDQIERQKDWVARYRRHQGEVGPVGGFVMQYVVERQQLSIVDELRNGRGMMRIGVSHWRIDPASTLRTETGDEALRRGSAFFRTLMASPSGSTLTFWVYPDSFPLYRELLAFVQREGFQVAARPLPLGTPIAGSPQGTRSAGQ